MGFMRRGALDGGETLRLNFEEFRSTMIFDVGLELSHQRKNIIFQLYIISSQQVETLTMGYLIPSFQQFLINKVRLRSIRLVIDAYGRNNFLKNF